MRMKSFVIYLLLIFLKGDVQADFEFFDPKPRDFNGVKILLKNYLDDKGVGFEQFC